MKPSGINTTQVVTVEPKTEPPTVLMESMAASRRVLPLASVYRSIARKQASSTTVELSTIMPTPSTRADMVIMFME